MYRICGVANSDLGSSDRRSRGIGHLDDEAGGGPVVCPKPVGQNQKRESCKGGIDGRAHSTQGYPRSTCRCATHATIASWWRRHCKSKTRRYTPEPIAL